MVKFKTSISAEKVLTDGSINPILHKIVYFTRVNKENKKRDKSQKQDLSRCVDNSLEISNISLTPKHLIDTHYKITVIIHGSEVSKSIYNLNF